MALIDFAKLLELVTPDAPCGDNLEYDPAFRALEEAAKPKPPLEFDPDQTPKPPDWREVQRRAEDLFERSKDLQITLYLVAALLHNHGLPGLRDGLQLLQNLLDQYWPQLHPQLDPSDGYDPTLRINQLSALCDLDFLLRAVRAAPLVSSARLGRFSLRDLDLARGTLKLPADATEQPPDLATIEAAFLDGDIAELQATATAVADSLAATHAIEDSVARQIGDATMLNLDELVRPLKEAQTLLNDYLSRRTGTPATTATTQAAPAATGGSTVAVATGPIASRDDVIRLLDQICDYYQRYEPSSPVPLLLQRARRLVAKDFMAILQDLVPDSLNQAELICGASQSSAQ